VEPVDGQNRAMKTQREPVTCLLTEGEAAQRFGRPIGELKALVAAGSLTSVRVSARSGLRFWPADITALIARTAAAVTDEADGGRIAQALTEFGRSQAAPSAATDPDGEAAVAPARSLTAKRGTSGGGRRQPPERRLRGLTHDRPRWPRFVFVPERQPTTYLAFSGQAEVGNYLELRKQLSMSR
jgi:hypothetical protein